jgi:anti-sigma factor RsiW
MLCPDDAVLDLWLDGALAPAQGAPVAAHLATCPSCATRRDARLAEERRWQAVLALDAVELSYLARADLAAVWRKATVPVRPAYWWPALVLLGAAGAYAGWLVALPALEWLAGLASRFGLLGLALAWVISEAWYVSKAVLDALARPPLVNPALVAASLAAALWLGMSRPWGAALARTTARND